jgi:hypothetical protein
MSKIATRASSLKVGTWMVTLSKKLATADPLQVKDDDKRDWECVLSIKKQMSWGVATVHIQRKIK